MTLAIRWLEDEKDLSSGGFLYFNAVTAYTQNYGGQVTKHPIDVGASVTDHFIRDNPIFTLSGVFTSVDISRGSYLIQDLNGNLAFNEDSVFEDVSVNDNLNTFKRFVPEVIDQFLPDTEPSITMQAGRQDLLEQVRDLVIGLTSGEKFNEQQARFDSYIQLISLYEYERSLIKKITNNLVLTRVVFREDVNTGYALYADMTFEQVKFVTQKKQAIPPDVVAALKKKGASKETKGKQDSKVQDVNDSASTNKPKSTDPLRKVAAEL